MENTNLNKALHEAGKFINERFRTEARDKGHVANNNLDKSFRYTVVSDELKFFSEEYAKAISEGIKDKGKYSREMSNKLIKWAKAKGLRPQFRNKKGRFQKVTSRSWRNLGFVLARSIAGKSNAREPKNPKGGISKRFGYKGSGFIQTVKDQTEKKLMEMIDEGYRKDLEAKLDTIKKTK